MIDYIFEKLKIVDRISGLGENLAQNLVVVLSTTLEARSENDLTIGLVIEKLDQEYVRRSITMDGIDQSVVKVSAYLPYDSCRATIGLKIIYFVVDCDENSHHIAWVSLAQKEEDCR